MWTGRLSNLVTAICWVWAPAQKAILENVLQGKGFTPSDAQSMELLITRRVLEQSESAYEVHPALVTVLSQTQNRSE